MDTDRLWFHVHSERAALVQLLRDLPPSDWDHPSLCEGWAVRHVAAHVINSAETTISEFARALWRAGGDFNQALFTEGIRAGSRPVSSILAAYDRNAGSRRRPLGTTRWDPLLDVLVHTQDIALPLGLTHAMPPDAAQAAAERVWARSFPFYARRRLDRLRLSATDINWSAGDGPAVRGPISALLLLMTGRDASLPQLEGEGVELLLRR